MRNKAKPGWYAVQGWKRNKIRPDFIVAKKKDSDVFEIVYILESKGEQLLGNKDTAYKKSVLDLMTQLHRDGKLKMIKTRLVDINGDAEAYLIEQGNESFEIKRLMA